jgi:prepilin-type N-terminal cleavage/methylation domain-containing protein
MKRVTWWGKREGFTLIELLVVIAIIGVLATLLILQLGVARQRARDAKRIGDINQIRTGLEFYFDSFNSYPATADLDEVSQYLQGNRLPADPIGSEGGHADYGYVQISRVQYHLWAELEQKATAHDADLDHDSSGTTGGIDASAGEGCGDESDADCLYDVGQVN